MSNQRIDYRKASPKALEAMMALSGFVESSGLDSNLLNLVFLRVSQINGCALCINMHTKAAKKGGETEDRLCLLPAWHDAKKTFTDKEQAALEWAEAVTLVKDTHVPDEVYQKVSKFFSDEELVNLTMAVVAINGWNRLNIAFKMDLDSFGG